MSKISVSLGYKKNMGNFENIDLFASLEVEVEDPYDKDAWTKAWDEVDEQLSAKLVEVTETRDGKS